MGSNLASHDPEQLKQYRQAEQALLGYYQLADRVQEIEIAFTASHKNRRLYGITRARVWQGGDLDAIPIVFVHGGGGTPLDFAPILPYLLTATNKYRVICVERPGNGTSDLFDYCKCPSELSQFTADFLHELLEELHVKQPAHLVANSMGGFCMFYALQYPQQVASLSFLGVPGGFQGLNMPFYFDILKSWVGYLILRYFPILRIIPLCLMWIIFRIPLEHLPRVYIDNLWRAHAMRNNLLSFHSMLHPYCNYARSKKGWKLEDLLQINETKFPVLFVDAPGDPFISKQQRKMITACLGPNQHLEMGKGHLPWFVDPKGFAFALEQFWTNVSS